MMQPDAFTILGKNLVTLEVLLQLLLEKLNDAAQYFFKNVARLPAFCWRVEATL